MSKTSITYLSGTDKQGRCRFLLEWQEGNRIRGQVFFADPIKYGHKRP